jgi:hypothetical protein
MVLFIQVAFVCPSTLSLCGEKRERGERKETEICCELVFVPSMTGERPRLSRLESGQAQAMMV